MEQKCTTYKKKNRTDLFGTSEVQVSKGYIEEYYNKIGKKKVMKGPRGEREDKILFLLAVFVHVARFFVLPEVGSIRFNKYFIISIGIL